MHKKMLHHHPIFIPILVINQAAKSMSLWRAARNNDRQWYLLLAFSNTLGILDLIYMFISRNKTKKTKMMDQMYPSSSSGQN